MELSFGTGRAAAFGLEFEKRAWLLAQARGLNPGEHLVLLLVALLVASLSAWATLRAFTVWKNDPSRLPLFVLLAWFPPILGPLLVLWLARGKLKS